MNRRQRRETKSNIPVGSESEPQKKQDYDKLPLEQRKQIIGLNSNGLKDKFAAMIGQVQNNLNKTYDSSVEIFKNEMFSAEDKINELQKKNKRLEDLLKKHKIKTD